MGIQAHVTDAVARLKPTCTMDAINDTLGTAFVDLFKVSGYDVDLRSAPGLYTAAVRHGFYSAAPVLKPDYRECGVIALLASQGAEGNLALHLFIALMAGIAVDDVIDILFLTGIYCGANRLTESLKVAAKTFDAIVQAANSGAKRPEEVFAAILERFPDPGLDAPRHRLRSGPR